MDMTLSPMRTGRERKGEGRERKDQLQQPGGPEETKEGQVSKMADLYREGQPFPGL